MIFNFFYIIKTNIRSGCQNFVRFRFWISVTKGLAVVVVTAFISFQEMALSLLLQN